MKLPVVSIVGRPNVGKSSLLNCLAGRLISIVDPTPGVTRDRVSVTVPLQVGSKERYIEIVDTGGIGIVDIHQLDEEIDQQISVGIETADVILFLVDGREGLTPLDRRVAEKLRRLETTVIFVANKIDNEKTFAEIAELNRLGFGEPIEISAAHHRNISQLLERISSEIEHLPPAKPGKTTMKLAIVGKRNAGKSTLINALAGDQRVIVSDIPGTTRDSVDVNIQIGKHKIMLIDTAGLKRKGKLAGDIEYYSQHRSMRSVRRADVVAMMIDASLPVSKVDRNLAGVISEEYKPVIIVVNKWDLARNSTTMEDYAEYFGKTFPSLSFAPICFTSATEELNLVETIHTARHLYRQAQTRVGTGQLNRVIEEILEDRGPSHKAGTRPPKIYYVSQVTTEPPTIVCFVNDTRSFDEGFRRFLVNRFRECLPFSEVPIKILMRAHGHKESREE